MRKTFEEMEKKRPETVSYPQKKNSGFSEICSSTVVLISVPLFTNNMAVYVHNTCAMHTCIHTRTHNLPRKNDNQVREPVGVIHKDCGRVKVRNFGKEPGGSDNSVQDPAASGF